MRLLDQPLGFYQIVSTTVGLCETNRATRPIRGAIHTAPVIYLFVARMGATAELKGVATQAVQFLAAGFLWIFIHGGFCLLGAKLLRVDVHTAAIASAATIGGAASAPIVAAYHNESLVPASILMALIGYALGNYAGYLTALLCSMVAP